MSWVSWAFWVSLVSLVSWVSLCFVLVPCSLSPVSWACCVLWLVWFLFWFGLCSRFAEVWLFVVSVLVFVFPVFLVSVPVCGCSCFSGPCSCFSVFVFVFGRVVGCPCSWLCFSPVPWV